MKIGIYYRYDQKGPGKVVKNLVKGFDLLNIDYVINSDGDINVILQDCDRLKGDLSNCYIGPNVVVLPIDNNIIMDYNKYLKLIVPSEWVKKLYSKWIPEDKIIIWSVGIDTNLFFQKSNIEKIYDFLIYFKRRDILQLKYIKDHLNTLGRKYIVLEYGDYTEENFINLINISKFGIIIDGSESQGIAIQEMMSCNLPLIVWDIKYWLDRGEENKCFATSVPYWNDTCGEIFFESSDFIEKLSKIEIKKYNPRKYVLKELSLSTSVGKLIKKIS